LIAETHHSLLEPRHVIRRFRPSDGDWREEHSARYQLRPDPAGTPWKMEAHALDGPILHNHRPWAIGSMRRKRSLRVVVIPHVSQSSRLARLSAER
jgi:hypothetical protein